MLKILFTVKDRQLTDSGFGGFKFKPPPINENVEGRCQSALRHVSLGLECLKYFPSNSSSAEEANDFKDSKVTLEEPSVANPYESIPLHYEPLKKTDSNSESSSTANNATHKKKYKHKKKKTDKTTPKTSDVIQDTSVKALLCKGESQTLPTWQAPKKDDNQSWAAHLKILLFEKASLVLAVQAEDEYSKKNYGLALKRILSVLRCQKMMETFCYQRNDKLISHMLGRSGDCYFMTVQDWKNIEIHRRSYNIKEEIEDEIYGQIFLTENSDLCKLQKLKQCT